MKPNDDAFPSHNTENGYSDTGLTKREYIATQILAGFAACDNDSVPYLKAGDKLSDVAVKWADDLIDSINKPRKVSPRE